jgi:hypothetical protein
LKRERENVKIEKERERGRQTPLGEKEELAHGSLLQKPYFIYY